MAIAGRSDWDDGRWEWEESPRRDSRSSSRHYQPSPSPMLVGASPDARLVSPWLGGNTPQSGMFINSFGSNVNLIFFFKVKIYSRFVRMRRLDDLGNGLKLVRLKNMIILVWAGQVDP